MDNNNKDLGLQFLNFAKEVTPLPTEVKNTKAGAEYIKYGTDNLYPNFLLKLYNNNAIHKGILTTKVDFIVGDGLVDSSGNNIAGTKVNPLDTLEEFVNKIVKDYVIFNAFAVEVIYNLLGKPIQFIHVPVNKVRPNRDKSKFWTNDDWFKDTKNLESFDRFILGSNADGKSKMFYYSNYTPSVNNIYPELDYSGGITSIVTDTLVNDFFQHNITNGFSLAHIVSSFKGTPDENSMRLASRKFEEVFRGVDGQKFILDFNNQDGKPLEVQAVAGDDYANKLIEVLKKTEQNILSAHQATSPMLFGIKTEGQLGGTTEQETAYELFKISYIKNRRNELESGLNKLFTEFAPVASFQFKDKVKLFTPVISDATKEKVFTINELRAEAGLPKIEGGDRLLSANATPSNFSNDKADKQVHQLTEEDFEKIKHKGVSALEFEIIKEYDVEEFSSAKAIELAFDNDSDIIDYILKNDIADKSEGEIKAIIKKELGLDITKSEVTQLITKLIDSNVIDSNKKAVKQPETEPERKVEVMYSYQKRPEISGEITLPTSRAFCKKLCETEKLFSRTDIQDMSALFGYDVFKYAGGFYHNKETGKTTPFCRHYFKRVSVIRKGEKK